MGELLSCQELLLLWGGVIVDASFDAHVAHVLGVEAILGIPGIQACFKVLEVGLNWGKHLVELVVDEVSHLLKAFGHHFEELSVQGLGSLSSHSCWFCGCKWGVSFWGQGVTFHNLAHFRVFVID
jgi:hypothetical protein